MEGLLGISSTSHSQPSATTNAAEDSDAARLRHDQQQAKAEYHAVRLREALPARRHTLLGIITLCGFPEGHRCSWINRLDGCGMARGP